MAVTVGIATILNITPVNVDLGNRNYYLTIPLYGMKRPLPHAPIRCSHQAISERPHLQKGYASVGDPYSVFVLNATLISRRNHETNVAYKNHEVRDFTVIWLCLFELWFR